MRNCLTISNIAPLYWGAFSIYMNPEKDWIYQQFMKETANKVKPLASDFLISRGFCCGNKCKNCPYEPKYQKGNTELQTIYKK